MRYNENKNRKESLLRLVPDLFSGKYKSVLYVGAKERRFHFGEDFKQAGFKITIVEVFEKDAENLKKIDWVKEVICCDITTFNTYKKYDVIFWWHGPEHIEEFRLPETIKRIEGFCNNVVILGCPWGMYKQGAVGGNENEIHLSHYDHASFEKIGYEVECLGIQNAKGSNITAVKIL